MLALKGGEPVFRWFTTWLVLLAVMSEGADELIRWCSYPFSTRISLVDHSLKRLAH
jgi:hypothetical protein